MELTAEADRWKPLLERLFVENTGFTVTQWKSIGRMSAELNAMFASGRLATMTIIRMFFHVGLTGSARGGLAFYTDSPRRAFEDEMSVLPPGCLWDPLKLRKRQHG